MMLSAELQRLLSNQVLLILWFRIENLETFQGYIIDLWVFKAKQIEVAIKVQLQVLNTQE